MSMKADLTKEEIPENDDDYEKIVEEVFDEKYGRKRFVVKKIKKERNEEREVFDGTNSIQETVYFKRRTEDLGLDRNIGQRINVIKDSHKSQHGGFYCQLCDTHVWDSNAWLDHINGKTHNRLLGMNNKVERVGIEDIKAKLQSLKKEKLEKNKAYELMLQDINDEDQSNRKIKNERKKLKTEEQSTFGPTIPENLKETDKKKEENTEDKKDENQEKEKKEEDEEEEEEDPEAAMMAMMGLPTSFNTKKK